MPSDRKTVGRGRVACSGFGSGAATVERAAKRLLDLRYNSAPNEESSQHERRVEIFGPLDPRGPWPQIDLFDRANRCKRFLDRLRLHA